MRLIPFICAFIAVAFGLCSTRAKAELRVGYGAGYYRLHQDGALGTVDASSPTPQSLSSELDIRIKKIHLNMDFMMLPVSLKTQHNNEASAVKKSLMTYGLKVQYSVFYLGIQRADNPIYSYNYHSMSYNWDFVAINSASLGIKARTQRGNPVILKGDLSTSIPLLTSNSSSSVDISGASGLEVTGKASIAKTLKSNRTFESLIGLELGLDWKSLQFEAKSLRDQGKIKQTTQNANLSVFLSVAF